MLKNKNFVCLVLLILNHTLNLDEEIIIKISGKFIKLKENILKDLILMNFIKGDSKNIFPILF